MHLHHRWLEWYLGSKPLVVADYLGRCLANRQRGGGALGGISANATVKRRVGSVTAGDSLLVELLKECLKQHLGILRVCILVLIGIARASAM